MEILAQMECRRWKENTLLKEHIYMYVTCSSFDIISELPKGVINIIIKWSGISP